LLPHERRQLLGADPVQRQAAASPYPAPAIRLQAPPNAQSHIVRPHVLQPKALHLQSPGRPLLPHERRASGPVAAPVVLPAPGPGGLGPRGRSNSLPARLPGGDGQESGLPREGRTEMTRRRARSELLDRSSAQASGRLSEIGAAMLDGAASRQKPTPAQKGLDEKIPSYRRFMGGTLVDLYEKARYGRTFDPDEPSADEPAYRKYLGGTLVDLYEKVQSKRKQAIVPDDPTGDGAGSEDGRSGDGSLEGGAAGAKRKPSRLRKAMRGTLVDIFDKISERKASRDSEAGAGGAQTGEAGTGEARRSAPRSGERQETRRRSNSAPERRMQDTSSSEHSMARRPRSSSEMRNEGSARASRSRASTVSHTSESSSESSED
jgi:hypothetical protein